MKKIINLVDLFDEKIMHKIPMEKLTVKTKMKPISIILLFMIMLSTVSPVAYNAQGFFADSLDQISENTSGTKTKDDSLESDESIISPSSDSDNEEMTDEQREEYFANYEKELEQTIWKTSINDLTKKDLSEIGIEETKEQATVAINRNVKVEEAIKLFIIVDNYNNLPEADKTQDMNKKYKDILDNGFTNIDMYNMTLEEEILLETTPASGQVNSVIKYNGKNYKINSDYYVIDYALFEATTINSNELNKNLRTNTYVESINFRSRIRMDGHLVVGIHLSNGMDTFCVNRNSALENGYWISLSNRSDYFSSWTKEAQAIATVAAYINSSTLPVDTSAAQVGSTTPDAKWLATQSIIWAAEQKKFDHTVTVDEVTQYAKDRLTRDADSPYTSLTPIYNEIDLIGEDIKTFMSEGEVDEGDYLVKDLCSHDSQTQDQISSGNDCTLPELAPHTGNVIIKKTFDNQGYPDYNKEGDDIEIVIKNKNGNIVASDTLGNDGKVEFDDLSIHGNPYTWEEVNNTDHWNTVVGSGTFDIAKDRTITVDYGARGPVNQLKLGSLDVIKTMINDTTVPFEEITSPTDVEITVDDNESTFEYHEQKVLDSSWSASFTDMPFGEYTVTEAYDTVKTKGVVSTQTVIIDSETIPANVELTNEIKWGNLKVKKQYINDTGLDNVSAPEDVTIRINSLDGYSTFPREQTLESDWTTTFEYLPWGNYEIIETAFDEQHTEQVIGYARITMSDANPGDEGTRELSVDHPGEDGGYIANEVLWANLVVEKNIINDTDLPANTIVDPGDISITVKSQGEDFIYEQTFSLNSNWQAEFEKLPVGSYTAEEAYTGDAMNCIISTVNFDVVPLDNETTIEISKNSPFNGQYIENDIRWANLKVTKNMINDTQVPTEELTSPSAVEIRVKSAPSESFNYDVTQTLNSSWTTTFKHLPVGHYIVEETLIDANYSKEIIDSVEVDVTASDDKQTIEISKNQPVLDGYIENEILWANLVVTKNMINDTAVDVEDITSPDQVQITLESLDGYSSFPRIETLDSNWEASFNKLPVGSYKITETAFDENHTEKIMSSIKFSIEAADDETIIYIDKDHPVGDAYIENEILHSNLVITKNMINDTIVDTNDITSPSQVYILVESLDGYSSFPRIQQLNSNWSTTFTNLPVGSYEVKEMGFDENHTKQIMDEVTVDITKEDNDKTVYIDKEHSIGDAYIENEILHSDVRFTKNVNNLDNFSKQEIESVDPTTVNIHVQNVEGEVFEYDQTQSLDENWSTTFQKLPVGQYHYEEILPSITNMDIVNGEGYFEVTPNDDEQIIDLSVENEMKYFTVKLTAKDLKTEEPLGAGYNFAVYDSAPEIKSAHIAGEETEDYTTTTTPIFTMETNKAGEAFSPMIMFEDTEIKDLYIYETDVEKDKYGNDIYHLNDGGISVHATADVSNKEEISLDYYNLPKDYTQVEVNTKLVDTEGNSIENYNLEGFEYTIYDDEETSQNYGEIAMSAPYENQKSKKQILITDEDGEATSDYLYTNESVNQLDEKPEEELLSYRVSQTKVPDQLEGKLISTPDDYAFNPALLTNMYYYEAENMVDDGEIKITKIDEDNNLRSGAEFTIYEAEDDEVHVAETSAIKTLTTNDVGVAKIKLPLAKDYYIKETRAPEGLTLDSTIYEVDFSEDGTYNLEVVDQFITTNLIIYNRDSNTNEIITGSAKFNLTYTYDGKEYTLNGTTTNGKLEFDNVPIVNSDGSQIIYTLAEVQAPGDYIEDTNDYQFKLYFDENNVLKYETVYSQQTGKLETTSQATGTLTSVPEDVTDTTVDMDFYNYKETEDIVEEMPDTSNGILKF